MPAPPDKPPVIAVDGQAGVGKGTVGRLVAGRLGFRYLDSGRMYRLVGAIALAAGADLDDVDQVLGACADQLADPAGVYRRMDDKELGSELAGEAASRVSRLPRVRTALMAPLHGMREPPGLVADGRDMGTLVFPDATLKVFLEASLQVREQRARKRLEEAGSARITDSLREFRRRDKVDRDRSIAPVKPAADAVVLATDDLAPQAVAARIVDMFHGRRQASG